jgi:hypothetical protein
MDYHTSFHVKQQQRQHQQHQQRQQRRRRRRQQHLPQPPNTHFPKRIISSILLNSGGHTFVVVLHFFSSFRTPPLRSSSLPKWK